MQTLDVPVAFLTRLLMPEHQFKHRLVERVLTLREKGVRVVVDVMLWKMAILQTPGMSALISNYGS